MPLSLPAAPANARSLTDLLPETLRALEGCSSWFAPARSAIVFVIDGLGAAQLAARPGHARNLSAVRKKKDTALTVFPSTTAAALTSLLTGTHPGEHGIVGYSVRDPLTRAVVNQLKGWETDNLDPLSWQRSTPLFALEAQSDKPFFVVSKSEFEGSGFSNATSRGATFVSADTLEERMTMAAELTTRFDGALVYLYAPELDASGHKFGWQSPRWEATLEMIDSAAGTLMRSLAPDVGLVITSDHGMVDVARDRHVLLSEESPLLTHVTQIAGEPRMLHLFCEPGHEEAVFSRWAEAEGARSWVLTRAEADSAQIFGEVHPQVSPRIGDVIVAARADVAYYDDRLVDKRPQRMIGQHGSLTPAERVVPLLKSGAFA